MNLLSQTPWILVHLVLLVPGVLGADEKSEQAAMVDQAAIAKWVGQLDADSLTERQEARKQLTEAGKTAIPALAKAALSDKRDVIVHSIDILGEIAKESDEEATKEAAIVVLEMLAESDKPSTAGRAKLALDAKKDDGIQAFPGWDQPGSEFAGNGAAVNRSVSVSNFNGLRTITVKEAGQTTTMQDQPAGAIRVRITGGGKPKEFVAKSLTELKKLDPAAHALYVQHGGSARGMNIFNARGFGPAGAFGNGMNMLQVPVNAQALDFNLAGDNTANQMMIRQLTELKQRMAGNPQIQQLLDQQIKGLIP